jgi:hypothetical protein
MGRIAYLNSKHIINNELKEIVITRETRGLNSRTNPFELRMHMGWKF